MSSYLPFVALMSVPKSRRKRLLPLALPAVAGIPAATAGALAVVSADSVARREGNVATAQATTAVTQLLTTAVAHGAELTPDQVKHIPIVDRVVAANPDILTPASLGTATPAELQRAVALIQAALAEGGGTQQQGGSVQQQGGTEEASTGGTGRASAKADDSGSARTPKG